MRNSKLASLVILAFVLLALVGIIGFFSPLAHAVGPLDHFTFTTISSPAPYNTAFSITITAKDASEVTVTTYNGSNTLSISSGTVSPTSGLVFSSGVCTRTVTITGSPSLTVTLTTTNTTNSKTGTSNAFQLLDVFAIGTIASQTNGQAFSITITAQDHSSRTVTDYAGTSTLSVSSGTISPTTTTGGFSSGVWTGSVTLTGATTGGTVTVSTSGGGKSGTSNTFLMLSKFIFSTIPSGEIIAGTSFTIGITAQTYTGATVTTYAGPNTLSDTTGTLNLTTTGSFTSGVWSGPATITKETASSACKITTIGAGITLQSGGFTVRPAPLHHFTFNTIISPKTNGTGFSITFTAMDVYENQLTAGTNGYSPTDNALSASTGITISPLSTGMGGWTNGQWNGTVTLTGASTGATISTSGGGKSGTSNSFILIGTTLDHFDFSNIGPQPANTSFATTIAAKDSAGNTVTSFSGSVTLSDLSGGLSPTSVSVASGTWSGNLKVTSPYTNDRITATYSGKTGQSVLFNVFGTLASFSFASVGTQNAGSAFGITATALDSGGRTVANYTGTASLSYSAGSISPGSIGPFVGGVGTASVTVTKSGSGVTITATGSGKSGMSSGFTVNDAGLNGFSFAAIGAQTAGSSFGITVTAQDQYGNTVTGYASSTSLTETDGGNGGTVTPSPVTFSNGQWSGSVKLSNSGTGVTITATGGGKSGKSNGFDVALAATTIDVSCSPSQINVTALESTTISGHLMSGGVGVAGKTISLSYYNGTTYSIGTSDPTDSNGYYAYIWTPSTATDGLYSGFYVIKAEFVGDLTYSGSIAQRGTGYDLLVVPEYLLGALLALLACFAAFIVFRKRKSLPHLNFSIRN